MAIEAPLSKHKRNNFIIYIVVCVAFALWFGYDGYLNADFKEKHTQDGKADSTLVFNQWAPPFLLGAAVLLGAYLFKIRDRKIVAGDASLVIDGGKDIPYDAIEKIDKTYFDSKGYFVITYKDQSGKEIDHTISSRKYDSLGPVLDHLVAKIT
jgi:hypothetical protein